MLIFFVTRKTQNAVCKPRYCNSELCMLNSMMEEARRRNATSLKMHPIDLCSIIKSLKNEAGCKQGIKRKQRRCRSKKRRQKSCKFGKILKEVTKRKRRTGSSLGAISIQFMNTTIRQRRTRKKQEGVDCSKYGGRQKRVITVACVIGISALVCILLFKFLI